MTMLRIYFWLSFIIIATSNIRFTNAANCTSTTYNQQLDPTQLALSQITPEDFANATGTQLTDRLKELFNETLVSINCTVAKSTTSINVGYNIVYGCNETTATVLANGTTKTVPVNTNLNKTKVDQVVSCGLTDRANHVCLKANQVSAGITDDTACSFNLGSDNFFEWTIQPSTTTLTSALAIGAFKSNDTFNTALASYFSMRLNSLYPNQIANISVVSFNLLSNQQYALTFRLYFLKPISDGSLRTDIVTNLQTIYFGILKSYFTTFSKSIKIPASVKISVPTPISTNTKAIVYTSPISTVQSAVAATQLAASQIISSILPSVGTGTKTGTSGTATGTGGTATGTSGTATAIKTGTSGTATGTGGTAAGTSGTATGTSGTAAGTSGTATGTKTGTSVVSSTSTKTDTSGGILSLNLPAVLISNDVTTTTTTLTTPPVTARPTTTTTTTTLTTPPVTARPTTTTTTTTLTTPPVTARPTTTTTTTTTTQPTTTTTLTTPPVTSRPTTTTTTTTTTPTTTTTTPTTTTTTPTTTTTTTTPTTMTTTPTTTTTTTTPTTMTTTPTTTTTTTTPTTTTTTPTTTTTTPTTTTTTTTPTTTTTTTTPTTTTTTTTPTTTTTTTTPTTTTTTPTTTTTTPTTTTTTPTTTTTTPTTTTTTTTPTTTTTTTTPTTTTTTPTTTTTTPTTTTMTTPPVTTRTTTTTTTTTTPTTTTTTTEPTTTTTTTEPTTTTTATTPTTTTPTTTTTTTATTPTTTTTTTEPTTTPTTTTTTTEPTTTTTTTEPTTTTTTTEPTTTTTEPATTPTATPTTKSTKTATRSTATTTRSTTTRKTTTTQTKRTTTTPKSTTRTAPYTTVTPKRGTYTPKSTYYTTTSARTTYGPKTTRGRGGSSEHHSDSDEDRSSEYRKPSKVKIFGQTLGGSSSITIERRPYEFKNLNVRNNYIGLLVYLLRRRLIQSSSSLSTKIQSSNCGPTDIYVNYIYEYDIHNQVFNSSFQDPDSAVLQRVRSQISDWTSEELYKRNLVSYISDKARLTKIIDVSTEYENQSTIRIYVSINLQKNFIPTIRRVFQIVFNRLQKESLTITKENINFTNMVIIP